VSEVIKRQLSRIGGTVAAWASSAQIAWAIERPRVDNPVGNRSFADVLAAVINALLLFAGAIAVLFLIVGGFRYVVSAGNPDQVEAAKKTILYAVLGLIIIFVAFVLTQLAMNFLGVESGFRLLGK
jgi:type IV secretion system pilin